MSQTAAAARRETRDTGGKYCDCGEHDNRAVYP